MVFIIKANTNDLQITFCIFLYNKLNFDLGLICVSNFVKNYAHKTENLFKNIRKTILLTFKINIKI